MLKSQINVKPVYFDRYINYVPDMPVVDALHQFGNAFLQAEKNQFIALGEQIYAPEKWTVKDILQHIIDTERIFTYRALRFVRKDQTPLPGFDENAYADAANTANRTVDDLLLEFAAVRQSTLGLFLGFDEEMLQREGIASGNNISVLALGFTIVGHVVHHLNVIKDRYYPLLNN